MPGAFGEVTTHLCLCLRQFRHSTPSGTSGSPGIPSIRDETPGRRRCPAERPTAPEPDSPPAGSGGPHAHRCSSFAPVSGRSWASGSSSCTMSGAARASTAAWSSKSSPTRPSPPAGPSPPASVPARTGTAICARDRRPSSRSATGTTPSTHASSPRRRRTDHGGLRRPASPHGPPPLRPHGPALGRQRRVVPRSGPGHPLRPTRSNRVARHARPRSSLTSHPTTVTSRARVPSRARTPSTRTPAEATPHGLALRFCIVQ